MEVMRSLCWNYSDVSFKLCDEFSRAGILNLMYNDLKKFKNTYKTSEVGSVFNFTVFFNKLFYVVMDDVI